MSIVLRYFYSMLAGMLPKDLVYMCAIRLLLAAHDRGEMPKDMEDQLSLLVGKWTTHYNSLYPVEKKHEQR